MPFNKQSKKCRKFLKSNGWEYDSPELGGSGCYIKDSLVAVELQENEIILLDDTGDFLHLPMNYFALVGVMVEYRQIAANYISG